MRNRRGLMIIAIALLFGLPLAVVGAGRIAGLDRRPALCRVATHDQVAAPPSTVALVHAETPPDDAEIAAMVHQGLELALGPTGLASLIAPGDTVLLKPNLGLGVDACEITSWQVLGAVADACRAAGAGRVVVAESPAEGAAHYTRAGYIAHIAGVEYVDLGGPSTPLAAVLPEGSLWPTGERLIMPQMYLDADVVITLPKMKTHSSAGYTGALKNVFGVPPVASYQSQPGLGWRDLFHTQYGIHVTIPHVNLCRPPDLAVMDAIVSGEGSGPWGATPVETHMVLVSRDAVALDAVGAALMGIDPERVRHLVYAEAAGLGCSDLGRIAVVGADPAALARSFALPANPANLYRRALVLGSVPEGLILDGDLAEWPPEGMIQLDAPSDVIQGQADWDGPADASLTAWATWDEDHLVLAARVLDEALVPNERPPVGAWDGDGIEWFLSGAAQDEPGRAASYGALDHRLCLPWGQGVVVDVLRGGELGAVVATQSIMGGYTVEVALPADAVGFLFEHNREIGFDLALNDADENHRQTRLMWGGGEALAYNVCEMGVALLRAATAAVSPTPTATPSATSAPTVPHTPTPSHTSSPTVSPSATPRHTTPTPVPPTWRLALPLVLSIE